MSKYRVYLSTGASMTITVEADDEEQAIEKAFDEAPRDVCAQCRGWGQPWSMDIGEWGIETDRDGKEAEPELVED